MGAIKTAASDVSLAEAPYRLEEQVGFLLREVSQRHAAIFMAGVQGEITATQWAALAKLQEVGPMSQNHLGRQTSMDAATIKGVIDRLTVRGLTQTSPDPDDGRRRVVSLTGQGAHLVASLTPRAARITEETLSPLDAAERKTLKRLLGKLR